MFPNRRTQAGRISKSKANATIRRIIAPTVYHLDLIDPPVLLRIPNPTPRTSAPVEEIPRIDIAILNTLITRLEVFETGLDAVKTIIKSRHTKPISMFLIN